jgi:DNA helicase-2/ATP-dependent DNA helicase PcrA
VELSRFLDEIPAELLDVVEPGITYTRDSESILDGVDEPAPVKTKSGLDFEAIAQKALERRELTYHYDEEPDLRPGNQVYHARYGVGKVLSREGEGDQLKLTVSFAGHRPKKFLAKFAKLQRA